MEIRSSFKFEITETTRVLLYKIKSGKGKCWSITETDDSQIIVLHEIGHPEKSATIRLLPKVLHITTVRGYVYVIEDKPDGGAHVTFGGPVNALLAQALLPSMTYVPQTLYGKSLDMDDYAPIWVFLERRRIRHSNGSGVNPQDKYGWRVNMQFNNELAPWLPSYKGPMNNRSFKRVYVSP